MARFPHLNDSSFPDLQGVNVYQYKNEIDYSRFDDVQMQLTICAVPWDMGEAHVGARTISGIGNVVWFGSKENRDAWFNALDDSECVRFSSKYKSLQNDNEIIVPLPFDITSRYNYLMVEYSMFANDGSPVEYEDTNGKRKWFWFIREVEFLAPNSTRLILLPDAWQTWIYDVEIPTMMLERGHAPLFASPINDYILDPIDNCRYLLAPDVNYGTAPEIAKSESEFIINPSDANAYAVIVTTSNPQGTWGTKAANTWTTPNGIHVQQGTLGYWAIACPAANLSTLLNNINTNIPQFFQTIKCVFFVNKTLLTLGTSFTFQSVTCYPVDSSPATHPLIKINKSDFGFRSEYENLTKLYTYPYSVIEIYNQDGDITQVRIEDMNAQDISVRSAFSLVYPWIAVNGHLENIGKAAVKTLTFQNVTARTLSVGGNWLDYLIDWNIPTFGVTQAASVHDDYDTHYQRRQMQTAANNESANANAAMGADSNITGIQQQANTDIIALANAKAADDVTANNGFNVTKKLHDNTLNGTSTVIANAADVRASNIQATQGVVNGLLSGNISSALSGILNTGFIAAQTAISTTTASGQASLQNNYNDNMTTAGNNLALSLLSIATTFETDKKDIINTQLADELTERLTRDDAIRINNLNTATNEITNLHAQNSLVAPLEYGEFANGSNAVNRPQGLYAVVKTQRDCEIAQTGDEFLRYGYAYNGRWSFDGNWCIGEKFTYWKLSDFWVKGLNVPDLYMDRLRFFLFGGVTVWGNPADIGNTTIYDNGV